MQTIYSREELFDRSFRLVGEDAMLLMASTRVILFGVGGVGSWVAEGLVRSGVTHLTLVDYDSVSVSNANRQCPATAKTIGQVKVEAMKSRLLDINPQAEVQAICVAYGPDTSERFALDTYDYVIDAIDNLACKAALILHATSLSPRVRFFSSMGAALKMDPTQVRVDEFWKVQGCPLARALRQRFKREHAFPSCKFKVVYSPEVMKNHRRGEPNGSMVHVTAVFGFTLAGLVIQDLLKRLPKSQS